MISSALSCKRYIIIASLLLFAFSAVNLGAQQGDIDLNEYYRYPLAFEVEYQTVSPLSAEYSGSAAFGLSAIVRYPIPSLPVLQPFLQLGLMRFDFPIGTDFALWDHRHFSIMTGAAYVNRFSKTLEIGADAGIGFSQAIFSDLDPDDPSNVLQASSPNLVFSAAGRVTLTPSFNMSIGVRPNVKYLLSLSPLKRFNGFIIGFGVSASYRLGDDPDSAQTGIRSIRFGEARIDPLFAALRGFYARNPVGSVLITNSDRYAVTDVDVSFFQKGFMDNPTVLATHPAIDPGEGMEIPITVNFNEEVFAIEGVTTLTGEIKVVYTTRNRTVEQTLPVSYDLYDKTNLTWDDDRKVAAYITPADSALVNYTSAVRQFVKNDVNPGLSEHLQTGMMLYNGLMEIGCIYQLDPTSPFDAAQENPLVVDSVKLPRTTLKRATGDCDDLTVLYNSLLETVGIRTGFITTPGHIYSAFATGVEARNFRSIHPDKNMTMNVDGELWIPVEITMLGSSSDSFLSAWRRGAEEWISYNGDPSKRHFYLTAEAQTEYRPVSLRETDLGLQYGEKERIIDLFERDRDGLVEQILAVFDQNARQSQRKSDYNQLGINAAVLGRYAASESAFKSALSLDRDYLSAKVNLGNVYLLQERYRDAIQIFSASEKDLVENGRGESEVRYRILMSISRAYYELENFEKAAELFTRVAEIYPDIAAEYAYIAESSGSARGAQAGSGRGVIFAEEVE